MDTLWSRYFCACSSSSPSAPPSRYISPIRRRTLPRSSLSDCLPCLSRMPELPEMPGMSELQGLPETPAPSGMPELPGISISDSSRRPSRSFTAALISWLSASPRFPSRYSSSPAWTCRMGSMSSPEIRFLSMRRQQVRSCSY